MPHSGGPVRFFLPRCPRLSKNLSSIARRNVPGSFFAADFRSGKEVAAANPVGFARPMTQHGRKSPEKTGTGSTPVALSVGTAGQNPVDALERQKEEVIMSKKIEWEKLGFGYIPTEYRYVSRYKDGKWDEGGLETNAEITLSECACVFQYAQACFEGLKAYYTKQGKIVCFRPDLNAARMADSARRLEMPPFPEDRFVEAVRMVVEANKEYVPPYGSGATLYIRPFMIGTNSVIGVKPAEEYEFRIFVTPVGPYFKGGVKPISIKVSDFDRAAPHGTGHIKAGLNYAMSLHPLQIAHREGFAENMYLDPQSRTKVEETGGANFIFVTKDGTLVTPKSDSILPSITRRSILYVAEHYLNMKVECREILLEEVKDFAECGLCGTAAVISPVGHIYDHGTDIYFPSGMEEMGPKMKKIYETLTGIQMGSVEAPEGWIQVVAE